jgi:hypothetical protein
MLLFNPRGEPVAYATWAFLTNECGERIVRDPGYVLHPSERNEGDKAAERWPLQRVIKALPPAARAAVRLSHRPYRDAGHSGLPLGALTIIRRRS